MNEKHERCGKWGCSLCAAQIERALKQAETALKSHLASRPPRVTVKLPNRGESR